MNRIAATLAARYAERTHELFASLACACRDMEADVSEQKGTIVIPRCHARRIRKWAGLLWQHENSFSGWPNIGPAEVGERGRPLLFAAFVAGQTPDNQEAVNEMLAEAIVFVRGTRD